MLLTASEKQIVAMPTARRTERSESFCCRSCSGNVGMITAERAATLCQCSRRKIYHWIEEGHLHFTELVDGAVLVCGRTLAHKIEELSSTTNQLNGN